MHKSVTDFSSRVQEPMPEQQLLLILDEIVAVEEGKPEGDNHSLFWIILLQI